MVTCEGRGYRNEERLQVSDTGNLLGGNSIHYDQKLGRRRFGEWEQRRNISWVPDTFHIFAVYSRGSMQ